MELQSFTVNDQYKYTLFAKDAAKSSAIGVLFLYGEDYKLKLSTSTAVRLFLVYPKLHRLFNKFSFQGLITYRVDVDEDSCTTIELNKRFDKDQRKYIREWALNFMDLTTLKTTRWPFAWGMLPMLMSKSVELIKAINHWEAELKGLHQRLIAKRKNVDSPASPTPDDNTHDAINKEWVKVCACCPSSEPADITLIQFDVSADVAEWKGKQYVREDSDEKVESAIALALDRYGKEDYF
jgi:hypothetical protein